VGRRARGTTLGVAKGKERAVAVRPPGWARFMMKIRQPQYLNPVTRYDEGGKQIVCCHQSVGISQIADTDGVPG
jgi:hypothetical protein